MSDRVRERLDSLRARLILSPAVVSFHYQQEETVGDIGYFRVRCTLMHEGESGVVQAHAPVDAFSVLSEIEKRLSVD